VTRRVDLALDWLASEGRYEPDHALIDRLNSYLSAAGCTCWFEENTPARQQMGKIRVAGCRIGRENWNSLLQVVTCFADNASRGVYVYHKELYALYGAFLPLAGVSSDEEISLRLATMGY